MTNDADFHARRLTGLGGSEVGPALGISRRRTPYDVWAEKTGSKPVEPAREPADYLLFGTLLQPVILGEYVRRTGYVVEAEPPMLRHSKYDWMIGHLDGAVVNGKIIERVVEIKTSRTAEGWGEPGSDEIPADYGLQVHHYLIVSGAALCDVAVLIGGSDFRIYTIHADPVIAAELVGREAAFWQAVEQHVPPDPVNLSDAVARWGRLLIESAVRAGQVELDAIASMHRIRAERKILDEAEEQAKLVVMKALGEHGDTLVDENGARLATWAMDDGRRGYTVEPRGPARRFLLKG